MKFVAIFVLFGGTYYFFMSLFLRRVEKRNVIWQRVAASLGLSFVEGSLEVVPQISGEVDGVPVRATIEVEGQRAFKSYYVCVTVEIPGRLPAGLELSREGAFQRLGKALGNRDIQVGDADLDSGFIIKGHDAGAIRDLLRQPPVRSALLVAQRHSKSLRVEDRTVLLRESGGQPGENPDEATLTAYIRTCVDLALAFELAGGHIYADEAAVAPSADPPPATAQPASDDANDWW